MRVDRPPAEELNPGDETPARPAASAIVLRDSPTGPEVLLVERNPESRFMGGAWVFPGGAVQDDDEDPAGAALRELEEEANVSLSGRDELVPFSRWITPSIVETRFDTWFFTARMPEDADPRPDAAEVVDLRFVRPRDALDAGERDELKLVFPTIKHLQQLAKFGSVDDTLEHARERKVIPIQPEIEVRDGEGHVVLPPDAGFDW